MWEHFVLQPDISIAEKMLRPVLVYFFLMIGLRLAGKRELAQLNSMDLIVLLTISNTVQNAIIGSDNSVIGGLIGAATLLAVNYAVVRFLYSHDKIDRLIEGEQTVLVENGRLRLDRMQKELITKVELEAAAHKQGIQSLDLVEKAVLEPSGVVSFVVKQPVPGELRQNELIVRLENITRQLEELRKAVGPGPA